MSTYTLNYPYEDLLTFINGSTSKNLFEPYSYAKYLEQDGIYSILIKLPGYEKNEVKVSLNSQDQKNKYISISAENKEYGNYSEKFLIKKAIEDKTIKANLKNGILTVSFSLEKEKHGKSIDVEVN
jgi:HSP20 family molecular chaperone IbpA